MERLNIVKISPTQNMTVLVETPLPRERHAEAAEKLMDYAGVHCEQVGFIEPAQSAHARARLQMMGGEFCGNATMSLAAFLCFQDEMPAGGEADIPLEVSGADGVLSCRVRALGGGAFEGTVWMPEPRAIERRILHSGGTDYETVCVRMDGIAHILIDRKHEPEAEKLLRTWAPLFEEEAVGFVACDFARNEIRPLVLVKPTGSAVWERGCGSGSAAYGAAMAQKAGGCVKVAIRQPGGTIVVCADGESVSITGRVQIVMRGEAYL